MTPEKEKLENPKNILECPVGFVDRVKELSSNNDPEDRSAFEKWLLGQWAKIDLKISTASYRGIIDPTHPDDKMTFQRYVIFPDSSSLTQQNTATVALNDAKIEFLHEIPSSLPQNNKNHHTIRISFIPNPTKYRGLDKVLIEDVSLGVNPESETSAKRSRFVITVSPFDIVPADNG